MRKKKDCVHSIMDGTTLKLIGKVTLAQPKKMDYICTKCFQLFSAIELEDGTVELYKHDKKVQ